MGAKLKYLALCASLIVLLMATMHVLTSAAVAFFAAKGERMLDVRRIEGTLVPPFTSAVLASFVKPDEVLAAGSSFTFGFPYGPQHTFSAGLTREGFKTRNIGVQALGLHGVNDWLLCPLIQRGIRVKTLIVEIPLVNEMAWLPSQTPKAAQIAPCTPPPIQSVFEFALMNPMGTGWFRVLANYAIGEKPGAPIMILDIPPGYFASSEDFQRVAPVMKSNIEKVYQNARAISDNVIMFVSPIYLDGIAQGGADREPVAEQFARTQEMCRETAGKNCIEMGDFIKNPSNFYNLTHASADGAIAFAKMVAPAIVGR